MTSRASQSGNIFFYILIGIVLFAALAYAVSRNHINTDGVSNEKAKLLASEIIKIGDNVRQAVTTLRLRGCLESQIDFSNSVYQTYAGTNLIAVNSNAPTDKHCNVFDPAGANLRPQVIPNDALAVCDSSCSGAASQPGHFALLTAQMKNVGTDDVSGVTSANDLMMKANYINKNVCIAINKMAIGYAGLIGIGGSGGSGTYSNGSFAATGLYYPSTTLANGSFQYCQINSATSYSFLQVLMAR